MKYVRNATAAKEVVTSIRDKGGEVIAIQADARNIEKMSNLAEETIKTYGTIDILVHNAGLSFVQKSFEDITWNEFIQMM